MSVRRYFGDASIAATPARRAIAIASRTPSVSGQDYIGRSRDRVDIRGRRERTSARSRTARAPEADKRIANVVARVRRMRARVIRVGEWRRARPRGRRGQRRARSEKCFDWHITATTLGHTDDISVHNVVTINRSDAQRVRTASEEGLCEFVDQFVRGALALATRRVESILNRVRRTTGHETREHSPLVADRFLDAHQVPFLELGPRPGG